MVVWAQGAYGCVKAPGIWLCEDKGRMALCGERDVAVLGKRV